MDLRKLKLLKNIQNIGEFRGSMRAALKDAGYSQRMQDNPKDITQSKWFKKILPEYQDNANVLRDGTHAKHKDHYIFPLSMEEEEIREFVERTPGCELWKIKTTDTQKIAYFWSPDHRARQGMLDTVFKIRGDYAAVKITTVDPYDEMTDEQLDQELAKAKQEQEERRVQHG